MLKGIGTPEIVFIGILLIVLFGGKKLPELGRGLGQSIREFKKSVKSEGKGKK